MPEQATFGDFILGLEGLAVLRSWMSDPATVTARTRKIVEMVSKKEETPWANPMPATGTDSQRRICRVGRYIRRASNNPMFLAEGPVVRGLLASYPVGAALDAACGTGRHAAYLASLGHRVTGIDSTTAMLKLAQAKVPAAQFQTCRPDGDSPFGWRGGPSCVYAGTDSLFRVGAANA